MSLNLLPTTIVNTPLSGSINYDVSTQVVLYYSANATGNYQVNFRGDSVTPLATVVPVGQTLQVSLIVNNGSTPYSLTAVTVDGAAPTFLSWVGTIPGPALPNTPTEYFISITQSSAGVFLVR